VQAAKVNEATRRGYKTQGVTDNVAGKFYQLRDPLRGTFQLLEGGRLGNIKLLSKTFRYFRYALLCAARIIVASCIPKA
jgi:hypothetical protein